MRAVAHDPAFAKKVKIPQSVGREFTDADKRKEPSMAKESMKSGMSPRKQMASGMAESGAMGVESYAKAHGGMGMHPDHRAGTGEKGMMGDHERGAPPAMHHSKGQMPSQAAPDHGPMHPGGHMAGWSRDGMA